MEINIDDENKIVSIWCAKSEKADTAVKAIQKVKQYKKYTVAVFHSGTKDLYEGTKNLLRHNKDLAI